MGKPRVSWLLPVRNAEQHLESTLRSIASQDYPKQQVLVWDQGSTDRSVEVIDKWLGRGLVPGRVVGRATVERGEALGQLVRAADTELIARIDPGDLAEPDRLSSQARFLIENQRVGLVGSSMSVVDDPTHIIDQPRGDADLRWALRFRNPVNHPSVMLRRSAVLEVGNYRPLQAGKEDYDLWARLGLIVRFATLGQPLTRHLRLEASATDGMSADRGESFYNQRNALVDRLLPGTPASDAVRLLDLVRDPDDLSVTAEDLNRFQLAAQLAARACRYKADYFTKTALYQRQFENLKTRWLKRRPLMRPVWPLLKGAHRLIKGPQTKPERGAAA